jgi:hypothetical protein
MMIEVMALHVTLKWWKKHPRRPRKECGFFYHKSDPKSDEPFTRAEIAKMMARLKKIAPTLYDELLPSVYPLLFLN